MAFIQLLLQLWSVITQKHLNLLSTTVPVSKLSLFSFQDSILNAAMGKLHTTPPPAPTGEITAHSQA